MEFLVTIVVIIVLCICIGVEFEFIIFGVSALAALSIVMMLLLFTYTGIRIFFSERKDAEFSKIDKNPKGNFKCAYYLIDENEYPCMFPSEIMMKKHIYNANKKHVVRLDKRMGYVYDRYAVITTVVGFTFSFVAVIFVVAFIWLVFN